METPGKAFGNFGLEAEMKMKGGNQSPPSHTFKRKGEENPGGHLRLRPPGSPETWNMVAEGCSIPRPGSMLSYGVLPIARVGASQARYLENPESKALGSNAATGMYGIDHLFDSRRMSPHGQLKNILIAKDVAASLVCKASSVGSSSVPDSAFAGLGEPFVKSGEVGHAAQTVRPEPCGQQNGPVCHPDPGLPGGPGIGEGRDLKFGDLHSLFCLLKEEYLVLVKGIHDLKSEISTRDDIINGLMARVEQLEIKTHETLRTESQLPEMVASISAQPQPKGRGKAKVCNPAGVGENPTPQGALPKAKNVQVEPATSFPQAGNPSDHRSHSDETPWQTVQRPRRNRTRGNQIIGGIPSPSQRQPIVHERGICTNCRNANRHCVHDFRLCGFNLNRKFHQLIWSMRKIQSLPSSP